MKNLKQNKAITLIALIVTIIILLILAGVTIASLNGENGLFANVKLAKQKYEISEAKEKVELKITELRMEQEGKGESLKKEDLPKLNNDEIDVGNVENFPVEVICGKYKFSIDENFVVTYVGEANQTIITYTTNPEGYTNQNEIQILIKVSNPKGIKEIVYPDGDKLIVDGAKERGVDYTVTANGTYTFKVIDIENNEIIKDVVIDKIDKLKPLDFTPTIDELKATSLRITVNVQDSESDGISTKSGIERYEYYVNGNKYESNENSYKVVDLTRNTQYSIYVIAYDKAGNDKQSQTVTANTTNGSYLTLKLNGMTDNNDIPNYETFNKVVCDNDLTTDERIEINHRYYQIDPECWGKYVTIYCNSSTGGNMSFGSEYNKYDIKIGWIADITGKSLNNLCAQSILIPEGAYWGTFGAGGGGRDICIYEIWCSEENLTGQTFSNNNLPF